MLITPQELDAIGALAAGIPRDFSPTSQKYVEAIYQECMKVFEARFGAEFRPVEEIGMNEDQNPGAKMRIFTSEDNEGDVHTGPMLPSDTHFVDVTFPSFPEKFEKVWRDSGRPVTKRAAYNMWRRTVQEQ